MAAFWEVHLAEDSTYQAVVLVSNKEVDYCDIVPVDMVWKVVTVILNSRLITSISFNEVLHGYRADSST